MSEFEMSKPVTKETENNNGAKVDLMTVANMIAEQKAESIVTKSEIDKLVKAIGEQAKLIEEGKQRNKTLSKILNITIIMMVVFTVIQMACGYYLYTDQSNELRDHAQAINNNSYSIQSIVNSMRGN